MFHVALIILIALILICNVEGSTYMANGLKCDMCPAGTHWVNNCKSGNQTSECNDCLPGTFSETKNTNIACENCDDEDHIVCRIGKVFINACSATTNNRCECPDGQYWHSILGGDGACYTHSLCNGDNVVVKKGTATTDTECGPKPADSSSGEDKKDTDGDVNYDLRPKDSGEERPPGTDVNHDLCPPCNCEDKKDSNGKEGLWMLILLLPILLFCCFVCDHTYGLRRLIIDKCRLFLSSFRNRG